MSVLRCFQRVSRGAKKTILGLIFLQVILTVVFYLTKSDGQKLIDLPEVVVKTNKPYVYSHPKCQKNTSVTEIPGFDTLHPDSQNYLYYRHCHHFPMILDVPDKCGAADDPEDVFLLLAIKSPPMNYERREVIRQTWGKESLYKGKIIRRIFLSGKLENGEKMNKLLELEQQAHNDILQWDIRDSFHNLTLKQVLFLDWLDRNCGQVHFLFDGDDDVLANTDGIIDYLDSLSINDGKSHLFNGAVLAGTPPIRPAIGTPPGKYGVPVQVYEPEIYPPYCSGGGLIMSGYTALVIYRMSATTPLIPIDDAYMGICLEKANLKPTAHQGIRTWGLPSSFHHDPCVLKEVLVVHRYHPSNIYLLWGEMHDSKLNCGRNI